MAAVFVVSVVFFRGLVQPRALSRPYERAQITAVASISTFAPGSSSDFTSTSVIAG